MTTKGTGGNASPGGGQSNGGTTTTGSTGSGGATSVVGTVGTPLQCLTAAVGPSPLRRLTHTEYNNSVTDLLGDQTHPASEFPDDTQVGLFDNTASVQTVPVLLAGGYADAAVKLATNVANLTTLVGCDFTPAATGATCLRGFVQRFGRRAFRRPLTTDEVTRLMAVSASTLTDKQMGVRAVVASILASPHFLFRPEFGTSESTIPNAQHLTPFELAGRLGSLLWSSVPDDMLLDEAQAGRLVTPAQVATQARRMLLDPRARPAVSAFYDQFLGLSMIDVAAKDLMVYSEFTTDTLRTAMHEETRRFVDNVIFVDDAKLVTLLTAPYSFVNGPLATLYGVKGPADATTYSKVMFDPTQRTGVLTQGSFLAGFARTDESSPVKRGKWLRTRMLCTDLPDPPNNVPELPALPAGVSNRERFAVHTSVPACASCHHLVDGLGFGLERYDGIGRYRTTDNGVAVDSNGEVTDTSDINGKYNGAPELAALLARSVQVRDCLPTQWLRYSLARREVADDVCSLKTVRDAFAASGGNLRELMVSLTQTDAFLNYRRAD